jgi:hypothetical protein
MSNKRINKAYVRYDGTGRVIPGSLILNRFKPAVGNWKETPAYECCNSSPYCAPPVYEEDYVIGDIIEEEGGITFVILTNPFTNPILEVGMISCESNPPDTIITLDVQLVEGNVFNYFVPFEILSEACYIAFRRVCAGIKSEWEIPSP